MAPIPKNFPALLRAAGLTVYEVDGWQGRGVAGPHNPVGDLNHHTGASAKGWPLEKELAYAKWMFLTGRPDLRAPLCQIALGRSGVVYIGAAGRANHAGTAKASGSVAAGDGNTLYIGIEWMLSGTEAIPEEMYEAGVLLNAVLTKYVTGNSVRTISSHYQTSVTGKWDIGDPNGVPFKGMKVIDMDKFRLAVDVQIKDLGSKKRKPKRKNVVAVGWNLKVGRPKAVVRRELLALIKNNKRPAFVALQEARRYRDMLKGIGAVQRYIVHQPVDDGVRPAGVEIRSAGATALMVRKDIKVRERGALRLMSRWVGPQGGVQEGRVFPWVVARIDGKWTLVVSVHMPTGKVKGENLGAWVEAQQAIESLAAHMAMPFLIIGDWNTSHRKSDPSSPRAMAKRLGGRVAATDTPVDYALIKGHGFSVTKAAKRGSDHHAIRIVRKK